MSTYRQTLDVEISSVPILLITAGTSSKYWNQHLEWQHPPDTVMVYTQACQAVSNHVHVVPLDQLLDKEFQANFQDKGGLVVDLVGGLLDLELIGLPAAVARSLWMPCFPANTKNYVTTHDKLLGKHLAQTVGLKVARTLSGDDLDTFDRAVIQKPICGGDSVGIERFEKWPSGTRPSPGTFVEEFLLGQDATFHMIRNPDFKSYKVIDHLVSEGSPEAWFDFAKKGDANRLYGTAREMNQRSSYQGGLSDALQEKLFSLMGLAGFPFLGRIDVRQGNLEGRIDSDDVTFLELNVAPTISNANDWLDGIKAEFGDTPAFAAVSDLPIHPAAKSLAVMLRQFYAQSLSIQGNRPVREENRPN